VRAAALAALACGAAGAQDRLAPGAVARLELRDDTGRKVIAPARIERIVSLAPSVTETLFALGLEQRLFGVTDFCDFPPEARRKRRVGGGVNPSIESIVAERPDLVIVARSFNRRETVESLERLGIAVYATHAATVEQVLESIGRLADALERRERGEELVATLRMRMAELKWRLEGREPRRVLFVVWADPLVSIGPKTFLADALRCAGAESVVLVEQEWPRLSMEEVVRLQPEYLVFAESHSEPAEARARELAARPGWRALEAVRRQRITVISDAVNRPGPRLVDAIEQLARQLHPDAFEPAGRGPAPHAEKFPAAQVKPAGPGRAGAGQAAAKGPD
jgi:iron complex transport system substrate-binding protein